MPARYRVHGGEQRRTRANRNAGKPEAADDVIAPQIRAPEELGDHSLLQPGQRISVGNTIRYVRPVLVRHELQPPGSRAPRAGAVTGRRGGGGQLGEPRTLEEAGQADVQSAFPARGYGPYGGEGVA